MLHYLVTRDASDTMETYLQTWGRRLRRRVNIVPYDRLACFTSLPRGTYIWSDLERLDEAGLTLARLAWDTLATAGGCVMLNNPHRVLRREALLRSLHEKGRNPFAVHRAATVDPATVRYPAFVRHASRHDGSLTEPLRSPAELTAALAGMAISPDLLVVEFCNTADTNGTFRKYSAVRVGAQMIPRHLFHAHEWVVKHAEDVTPAAVAEEAAYLAEHPHADPLREIFDIAAIDYGRIDYSIRDGQVVTWEINTNPTVTAEPGNIAPHRMINQATFARAIEEALAAVAGEVDASGAPVRFEVPGPLRSAVGRTPMRRLMRRVGMTVNWLCGRPPLARCLAEAN